MRLSLAAIVLAVALACACATVPASGAAAKRGAAKAGAKPTCTKASSRARKSCRRVRVSAGMRRSAGRGRALLPPRTARPGAASPGAGIVVPGPSGPGGEPAPPAVDPPVTDPTDPVPVASTIGAEAYDFGSFVLRLTKPSVPAGSLTIYFRNYDVSLHNLWIDPPAGAGASMQVSAEVGEGGGATKTIAVTPGTWRFYCSLLGHEAMTRDLTVQ